jgi:F-type H+-transporting ATPase subunit gamma
MPSLKEVRIRIASVGTTQQITSAMKMVAASKLRRAQDAILQLRPYVSKMQEFLKNLASVLSEDNPLIKEQEPDKILMVVVTSNRGLCGAFNATVIRSALNHAKETYGSQLHQGNVHFLTVGKKGGDYFIRNKYSVLERQDEIFNQLKFSSVVPLAERIKAMFVEGKYQRVELIYNKFKNAAVQQIQIEQYLPLQVNKTEENEFPTDYIYQPDKETIINELIPKTLNLQLYKALLDSFASEHGARMTAMHKATDNAQELIRNLKLSYNKARQAAITKEITEIVSGAEALKG